MRTKQGKICKTPNTINSSTHLIILFLSNESHHILQHKKVGVAQWDRMFETSNELRCMVLIQKSLRESRPPLELREGVNEPVLRGKGEEAGSQRGRGRAYSPYQSRSHQKHGEGGKAAIFGLTDPITVRWAAQTTELPDYSSSTQLLIVGARLWDH